MAYDTKTHKTFSEWLSEITAPKRRYYLVSGDRHFVSSERDYKRQERVYVGRKQRSDPYIVICPESNCKVLIQTNGGVKGAKLSATWKKKM